LYIYNISVNIYVIIRYNWLKGHPAQKMDVYNEENYDRHG